MLSMISFDWTGGSAAARAAQWLLVAVASVVGIANVAVHWRSYDRSYVELLRLISMVERGALVSGVMVNATGQYPPYPPLEEVLALAVIERSAFVPGLFVYPTNAASSPLMYTASYAPMASQGAFIFASSRTAAQAKFDAARRAMEDSGIGYLLLIDLPKFALDVPPTYQLMGTTSDGTRRLFRVRK